MTHAFYSGYWISLISNYDLVSYILQSLILRLVISKYVERKGLEWEKDFLPFNTNTELFTKPLLILYFFL